ncbi:MAG: efflux RND transporter permease subunit [Ignavibacteria bacterium]|nr:efflux RND transporter permease subunit [Ignavibacteria bacterium]
MFVTFNSVKQGLLVFSGIPFAVVGGIFALVVRDLPFSISAGIGFIALFGVAVLNGIVMIAYFNRLEEEGETDVHNRIISGTMSRLRPNINDSLSCIAGIYTNGIVNRFGCGSSETSCNCCYRRIDIINTSNADCTACALRDL